MVPYLELRREKVAEMNFLRSFLIEGSANGFGNLVLHLLHGTYNNASNTIMHSSFSLSQEFESLYEYFFLTLLKNS